MSKDSTIEKLMNKATEDFVDISDIHKKLLKYGYNKPFTVFLNELKARVTFRKLFKK